jgi:hypothetical protein
MKDFSTRGFGRHELVAYDEKFAIYTDQTQEALIAVRRDKKKLSKRDKRAADLQIEFLLDEHKGGIC